MKKNEFWIYLAGIIDGEGCITSLKETDHRFDGDIPRYCLRIIIGQSNRSWLEWLRKEIGYGSIHLVKPSSMMTKPSYQLSIPPRGSDIVLSKTIDYLQIKRDQALIAIEFRRTFKRVGGKGNRTSDHVNSFREQCHRLLKLAKNTTEPIIVPEFRPPNSDKVSDLAMFGRANA